MSDSNKVVITGGAGFIGANLIRQILIQQPSTQVLVIDNFSTGNRQYLENLPISVAELDLSEKHIEKSTLFDGVNRIYHLAADIDNRNSWNNPHYSIENNIRATLNLALAANYSGVKEIVYSSSATVYGDSKNSPYRESLATSHQTSLYGATKFAAEAILSVFAEHFNISINVFRFGNVLGPFCTHGHVFDFFNRLRSNEDCLKVLGDGEQVKTFIHVSDVVDALMQIPFLSKFEVYNLSRPDSVKIKQSAKWVLEELGLNSELSFGAEKRAWIGDNPNLELNVSKVMDLGWKPIRTPEQCVKDTVKWLKNSY